MTGRTALIIGGGIGGVSAALALHQVGFDVRLFERAKDFADVGAGITLRPSATRALEFLGLDAALRREGAIGPLMPVIHYRTGEVLLGRPADRASEAPPLTPMIQIHRADLMQLMIGALRERAPQALHTGHEFRSFEQDDGGGVLARFANGAAASGDVLIGCDGLQSAVRREMFGAEPPRFTGQVAWRCLIPIDRVRTLLSHSPGATYIGPGRLFTRYPIRGGSLLNCVAFAATDVWREEGWSTPSSRAEMMEPFQGWHADVVGLIEAAPSDGMIKWGLFDRDPLARWTLGRASLLGDAAHPMLPFLGFGAGVTLEDSVVLARALADSGDLGEGLLRFERARRDRTGAMLLASRLQGRIYGRADPETYATTPRPAADPRIVGPYDPVTVTI